MSIARLGETVEVPRRGWGKIKWIGEFEHGQPGVEYAGIALQDKNGNHNGAFKSKRYFYCKQGHGLIVRSSQLLLHCDSQIHRKVEEVKRDPAQNASNPHLYYNYQDYSSELYGSSSGFETPTRKKRDPATRKPRYGYSDGTGSEDSTAEQEEDDWHHHSPEQSAIKTRTASGQEEDLWHSDEDDNVANRTAIVASPTRELEAHNGRWKLDQRVQARNEGGTWQLGTVTRLVPLFIKLDSDYIPSTIGSIYDQVKEYNELSEDEFFFDDLTTGAGSEDDDEEQEFGEIENVPYYSSYNSDSILGRKVEVTQRGWGAVRWVGELPGRPAGKIYFGIELDKALGQNNGRYREDYFFHCKLNHGIFVPITSINITCEDLGFQQI